MAMDVMSTTTDAKKKGDTELQAKQKAEIEAGGAAIYNSLSDEVKASLGEGSGNIKFIRLLGNPFDPSKIVSKGKENMKDADGKDIEVGVTIGALFEALADVTVPKIDSRKKHTEELTKDDVDFVQVKAGEQFALTLIEAYVLAVQPEYSLFFGADVQTDEGVVFDPKGCKVRPNLITKQNIRIPKVVFSVRGVDCLRYNKDENAPVKGTLPVTNSTSRDNLVFEPMFEKFRGMLEPKTTKQSSGGTAGANKPNAVDEAKKTALYCKNLLDAMLKF